MNAANTIQPPAAPPLTPAEQRVLSAFRSMDADAQWATLVTTEAWAEANPGHKRPSLNLIIGGAA